MSRIGKKTIEIAKGAKVSVSDRTVRVEGSKGSLSFEHRPEVHVEVDGAEVRVSLPEGQEITKEAKALWGTTRALIANMIHGVTEGYEKKLEIVGVGWTANLAGQKLSLKLGFANTVEVPVPAGLTVSVEKQNLTVNGPDKQAVGEFAAVVRSKKPPEPYNGKGIKYSDEVIKKKQGKSFGS